MTDILTGRLVRLRALEPTDAQPQLAWVNDVEFRRFLILRYPLSLAQEQEWVGQPAPSYAMATFGVELVATGELVGAVSLRPGQPEDRVAELGISIGPSELRGRGLGAETLVLACAFGFDEMDLARIELRVFDGNDRARRAYERVGFVHEGTARQAVRKGGRRVDVHHYGLLPAELDRSLL